MVAVAALLAAAAWAGYARYQESNQTYRACLAVNRAQKHDLRVRVEESESPLIRALAAKVRQSEDESELLGAVKSVCVQTIEEHEKK